MLHDESFAADFMVLEEQGIDFVGGRWSMMGDGGFGDLGVW